VPGVALDDVDSRVAPVRLVVVRRWRVDPERAFMRVTQHVPAQQLGREDVLVERPANGELHGSMTYLPVVMM
jgi:hypothetical protein